MLQPGKRDWTNLIEETLGPEYLMIRSISLVATHLCVMASVKVLPYISNIQSKDLGIGIMGKGGNKGGVRVSFNVGESKF